MRIINLSFFLLIITACSESDLMIHKQNGLMLEDLKEKNTVINFWADWCPPCIKEIPELNALYEENKHELNVYATSVFFGLLTRKRRLGRPFRQIREAR